MITGASEEACTVVISITISRRASFLEESRVLTRLTLVRRSKRAATAILWRSKRFASTLARHSHCVNRYFQLSRTNAVEISRASRGVAFTDSISSAARNDHHGDVVTVHKADVEEIKIVGAVDVRPHMRPDQEAGMEITRDSDVFKEKPVVDKGAVPAPERSPGQTLDAELPLKFNLRAQLPSGEIVPVSLEYSNLHRWCHHCRLISHEIDTCPQLPDDQKEQFIKEKELSRDQGPYPRKEVNRNGENSRRATAPDSKAPVMQERRPVDYSQRDNRDSVWKRIDSRYVPREDHRRDHRHVPRDLEKQPHQKETYNKRRYEESFASSRQREEVRKTTSKQLPSKKSSEEEHLPSASHAQQPIDPSALLKPATEKPQRESIRTSSPEHVRERPFKLNLRKRSSDNQKLKGQVPDLDNASDEGSSAKKCLTFNEEKPPPLNNPQDSPPLIPPVKEKEKSWYEQTLEEEDDDEILNQEIVNKPDTPVEKTMEKVEDPDAEKILEDEDWMANEINYDDDDLMDEDDLLIEDMEQEEAAIGSAKTSKQLTTFVPSVLEKNNKLLAEPSPQARSDHRSDSHPAQTPSSSSRPSPAKKKRGSPSPLPTGVSLRQRNLLVGRVSKTKASKNGPKLSPAHNQVPSETGNSEMKETNKS
ncbi:LOW QUALITY PROTEIN: hypothetical protein HID58_074293 [Brassica napus]|uniref:Zinc knuckle CX2CX4HX4C domain-containing protein n=1 Tax=Brassica napus TaxID=3708 RepID=A0ABQ7YGJ1_BRANA|nr:LOW QUALITY PROTEIN: hypothetical protein HID58_074293 [Brassica napus]